jgi:photosystem II stability/assembly factor-like uncharacterized protein
MNGWALMSRCGFVGRATSGEGFNGLGPNGLVRVDIARRRLALAGLLAPLFAHAAPYAVEGPARVRAGALRGTLLDVARAGTRLVAVGERGHVLLSDDQGASWRQAKAVPTRVTLNGVQAVDAKTLWAAGHGATILRSDDAGESWTRVTGDSNAPDVLMSIHVDAAGRGLAAGGFGFALASNDGGRQWTPATLAEGEAAEKHLNRIVATKAGDWWIAAEGGTMLRAKGDATAPWDVVTTPYRGSLWTGVELPGGVLVAGGMRGNVVRSTDGGATWTHEALPRAGSITGAAVLPDGRPVLVGVDGTLAIGDAQATKWQVRTLEDRATLTGVVALDATRVIAASVAGMRALTI